MLVNEHNPKWKSTFVHEYRFEENQPIKIEIFDWDSGDFDVKNKLKDQDLIGRIETNMAIKCSECMSVQKTTPLVTAILGTD